MKTYLALVHHANQYLITDGYDNREGLAAILGTPQSPNGLARVLALHEEYCIPLNLHVSGTLLEAIAWHQPAFLEQVRRLLRSGLIELVGSCYGQNIMRFFSAEYNRKQLNEELRLYRYHLDANPESVRTFWPPERVWETRRMAPALRDARLLNNGYSSVLVDDRLLFAPKDPAYSREFYDAGGVWTSDLYRMHEADDGLGLTVFPISATLRRSMPPGQEEDWQQVRTELQALLVHAAEPGPGLLAVYADDMEKVAGIGEWGHEGTDRYEQFLKWLRANDWVMPVKLTNWAAENQPAGVRKIDTGTFEELAKDFKAGEGYERWYLAPDWAPYRGYFTQAEARVREVATLGGDAALLELAEKQLLVGNWETAWHTPSDGPHGDPDRNGHASPWARALTSHVRHAAVTAEAALWARMRDGQAHASLADVDGDGERELIIKNDALYAVFTPRWGGRLVYLYSVSVEPGAMVIGNPCDDWNWMEELNRYMEVPRNHPGALADVGFENDEYAAEIAIASGDSVRVRMTNTEAASAARDLVKEISLPAQSASLHVSYVLPRRMRGVAVEFGLSPDYLSLLRTGSACMQLYSNDQGKGWAAGNVAVAVSIGEGVRWGKPVQRRFGHGCMLRAECEAQSFDFSILIVREGKSEEQTRGVRARELVA
jgi:hypothetical protein